MVLPLYVSWHFYPIVFIILCFIVLLPWLLYVVEKLFSGHIYLVLNGSSVWVSISFVGLGNSWLQFPWIDWIDCLSPWAFSSSFLVNGVLGFIFWEYPRLFFFFFTSSEHVCYAFPLHESACCIFLSSVSRIHYFVLSCLLLVFISVGFVCLFVQLIDSCVARISIQLFFSILIYLLNFYNFILFGNFLV